MCVDWIAYVVYLYSPGKVYTCRWDVVNAVHVRGGTFPYECARYAGHKIKHDNSHCIR
jgi:hypothetical protein